MRSYSLILATFGIFAMLFFGGCSTIRICKEEKIMVEVQNSGWYLLNFIPLGSGDPHKPNSTSCNLFRNTVTLDNNIDMLNYAMHQEGAVGVRHLTTYTNDEYVFIVLLKRHSMHTSAELVTPELAKEVPNILRVDSRTIRDAKQEEEGKIEEELKALEEASKPPKKPRQSPKPSTKNLNKIKLLEF